MSGVMSLIAKHLELTLRLIYSLYVLHGYYQYEAQGL